MKIEKKLDSANNYEYIFYKDNLKLRIFFGGNLDLYWDIVDQSVDYDNCFDYENKPIEFIIDKDNMEVYSLFLKLYDDVLNKKVKCDEENTDDTMEMDYSEEFKEYLHKRLDETYNLLVNDRVISWHSDETYYETASVVNIELVGEDIKITFIKKVEDEYSFPGEISIRFRNSGSTYDPFNVVFMNHFNSLSVIDPLYHQIHMEEYIRKLK